MLRFFSWVALIACCFSAPQFSGGQEPHSIEEIVSIWKSTIESQPNGYQVVQMKQTENKESASDIQSISVVQSYNRKAIRHVDLKATRTLMRSIINEDYCAQIESRDGISWNLKSFATQSQSEYQGAWEKIEMSRYWNFVFRLPFENLTNCQKTEIRKNRNGKTEVMFFNPDPSLETITYTIQENSSWMPVLVSMQFHADAGLPPEYRKNLRMREWTQYENQSVFTKIDSTNELGEETQAIVEFQYAIDGFDSRPVDKECYLKHYGIVEPPGYSPPWSTISKLIMLSVSIIAVVGMMIVTNRVLRGSR